MDTAKKKVYMPVVRVESLELRKVPVKRWYIPRPDANKSTNFEDVT